jgi:hypothetical protein
LPRGYRFSRVPGPRAIEGKHGRFSLEIAGNDRERTVTSRFELLGDRVEPQEYAVFREFLREVDASLEQVFEAERGP